VRGYVGNPKVDFPRNNGKTDVVSALGKAGLLTVMKDLGLKEPYKGIVQLRSSEIAEDLAYYLAESEQIPSAVGVGVLVAPDSSIATAGGFLLQSLPPADESMIERVIRQIQQMPPLTDLLVHGHTPEQIISTIFSEIPYEILGTQSLTWKCLCSKARLEQALISLGAEELRELSKEGGAELVCEFCRALYYFTQDELEQLVNTIQ
jgi:molecular chaperone Hsp33